MRCIRIPKPVKGIQMKFDLEDSELVYDRIKLYFSQDILLSPWKIPGFLSLVNTQYAFDRNELLMKA